MTLIRNKQLKIFSKDIEDLSIYKKHYLRVPQYHTRNVVRWGCIQDLDSLNTLIRNSECIFIYYYVMSIHFYAMFFIPYHSESFWYRYWYRVFEFVYRVYPQKKLIISKNLNTMKRKHYLNFEPDLLKIYCLLKDKTVYVFKANQYQYTIENK